MLDAEREVSPPESTAENLGRRKAASVPVPGGLGDLPSIM